MTRHPRPGPVSTTAPQSPTDLLNSHSPASLADPTDLSNPSGPASLTGSTDLLNLNGPAGLSGSSDLSNPSGSKSLIRRRSLARRLDDRGSVAVFTVVFAVAVIFLTALIVDGGNAMNARERAADIAGQAARAAADDISPATLRQATLAGNALPIDWGTACGYAQQVVQKYGAGLSGAAGTTVTMSACPADRSSPTQAAITVQVTTRPLLGGGILGPFTETATGTATSECGNAVQQGGC